VNPEFSFPLRDCVAINRGERKKKSI